MKVKRKIILVITVLSAVLFLFNLVWQYLLPIILSNIFSSNVSKTDYISIIGGADGPTGIIVSGVRFPYIFTVLTMIITLAGVVYLATTKEKVKIRG